MRYTSHRLGKVHRAVQKVPGPETVTIPLTQWERFLINKHDPYFGAIATKMTACDQRVKLE